MAYLEDKIKLVAMCTGNVISRRLFLRRGCCADGWPGLFGFVLVERHLHILCPVLLAISYRDC